MPRDITAMPNRSRANRKYPFAEWADAQPRLAIRGEDFTCKPVNFGLNLRSWAQRQGYKAEYVLQGDDVAFCIWPKENA
jgi:hypothetical protein